MVVSHHGHVTDLPSLRQRFSVSLKGMTLANLMQVASSLNFNCRPLRLELKEMGELRLPCVLHWDLNHFVVLTRVNTKSIVIHDPASGRKTIPLAEVSKHFTGVALELSPNAKFQPQEEKQRIRLSGLMGKIVGLKRALTQILLLSLCLQVFAILSPFFMQLVVDHALVTADKDLIITLSMGFFLLMLIQTAVGLLRSWLVMMMATNLSLQWGANVFAHLLRLPVSFFEKRHVGDIVSRFGSIGAIQKTLTSTFIEAILDGVMAITMFGMMMLYSPLLGGIAITSVFVYALLRWAAYRPFREANEEQIVLSAKQQSHFLESIRGIQSIKLFNREDDRLARWLNLVVDTTNRGLKTQRMSLGFGTANTFIFGTQGILTIYFGANQVLSGAMSVGMLFAFVSYKDQFAGRIAGLIDKWVEVKMLSLHAERLADIALTEPEAVTPPGQLQRLDHFPASVELRDVFFRYSEAEPYVLKGLNLKIEAGESVAIVGASGCGKTTLMKIMLGILRPSSGEVLVGGLPLKHVGPAAMRQACGTVMQDDQLFAGSITDNICFFDPGPDQDRTEASAKLASIHDEIMAMPMGYNTLIGDMGSAVSGGQKQRILLARALYKRPKYLLLDEATSHLDVDRERLVNAAIKRSSVTRIIIAHRPETIQSAGRVVVIEAGCVSIPDLATHLGNRPGQLDKDSKGTSIVT
jgi:ATP-binding cassette, subfamily B, bacterial CvaB/MchF/RaxB